MAVITPTSLPLSTTLRRAIEVNESLKQQVTLNDVLIIECSEPHFEGVNDSVSECRSMAPTYQTQGSFVQKSRQPD